MGPSSFSTIVYSGTAKTPRTGGRAAELTVELVVDPVAGRIVGITTDLGLSSLDQLLWDVLVGREVRRPAEAVLLEVEVRYCSLITGAVCKALSSALLRAHQDTRCRVDRRESERARPSLGVLAG